LLTKHQVLGFEPRYGLGLDDLDGTQNRRKSRYSQTNSRRSEFLKRNRLGSLRIGKRDLNRKLSAYANCFSHSTIAPQSTRFFGACHWVEFSVMIRILQAFKRSIHDFVPRFFTPSELTVRSFWLEERPRR
jgi:hypothetical protein